MSGYAFSSRPLATGWGVPSGETSEITAQMPVSGAVLDRRTSRLAGPADSTSAANGLVVCEGAGVSARLMSVSGGKAVARALTPAPPRIAVLGGSLLLGSDGSAG